MSTMRRQSGHLGRGSVLVATLILCLAACALPESGPSRPAPSPTPRSSETEARTFPSSTTSHPYVGMWTTEDGAIRQRLDPTGRYDEARGTTESAYTGSYTVNAAEIFYLDDTGFTAEGVFINQDELHHGGYVFYRQ